MILVVESAHRNVNRKDTRNGGKDKRVEETARVINLDPNLARNPVITGGLPGAVQIVKVKDNAISVLRLGLSRESNRGSKETNVSRETEGPPTIPLLPADVKLHHTI